jgi:hypothetical protein
VSGYIYRYRNQTGFGATHTYTWGLRLSREF